MKPRLEHLDVPAGTPDGKVVMTESGLLVIGDLPAGSAHVIRDEGTPLTQRADLDFQGAGVTVTDDAVNSKTVVTISGGGGGGGTGDAAWTNATLNANWRNYETAFPTTPSSAAWALAGFIKDGEGYVSVRGLIQNTSGLAALIFTLPAGYRPSGRGMFVVIGNSGAGRVDVSTDGTVNYSSGTTAGSTSAQFLSLASIRFKAA